MRSFYIRNDANWKEVTAYIHKKDGRPARKIIPKKVGLNKYKLDIDELSSDYITLSDGNRKNIQPIYINSKIDNYQIKHNKCIDKDCIYFDNANVEKGKTVTVNLVDKKNLSYCNNKKRVWIYTPKNYSPNKKYGVIISFDGQNAFYLSKLRKNCPFEGTQLDVAIESFKGDLIVVGIDNGNVYRDEELTMDYHSFGKLTTLYGKDKNHMGFRNGKLDNLLDFIKDTLLVYLKSSYSIDENNIGLVGASSGGLASFYGSMRNPEIYSYGINLSPAFFIFESESYEKFIKECLNKTTKQPKEYFYCGNKNTLEKNLCPATIEMPKLMIEAGYNKENVKLRIYQNAIHNELYWKSAVAEGLKFVIEK